MEVLSPAGSIKHIYVAINAGADAIYLGGSLFSARAYATNFDDSELEEAINYAHKYGVKIYLAVNTLIKNHELEVALNYINRAYEMGVDAIIVQDAGLAFEMLDKFEKIEKHASTQMNPHNKEGLVYLKERGFARAVLARELDLNQIEKLKDVEIEKEFFVQGALCICSSGLCLHSSMMKDRSANRGRCGQACRLEYEHIVDGRVVEKGHLLSPKDFLMADRVEDLRRAGIESLKIEGRMRKISYVYEATDLYRKAVDALEYSKENISKVFNREGFHEGYFNQDFYKNLLAKNNPSNSGIKIGKLSNDTIITRHNLKVGDGIRIADEGFEVSEVRKISKDTFKISPKPKNKKGDVYLTKDVLIEEHANLKTAKFEKVEKIDVDVEFVVGESFKIITRDGVFSGQKIDVAKNAPIDKKTIIKQLSKRNDTPIELRINNILIEGDGFLSIAHINSLRREVVEYFQSKKIPKRREFNFDKNIRKFREEIRDTLFVEVTYKRHLNLVDKRATLVINPYFRDRGTFSISDLREIDRDFYIKTSSVVYDIDNLKIDEIAKNKHFKGIVTSDIGVISRYSSLYNIVGDYKLNVLNDSAFSFYSDVGAMLLSEELTYKEMQEFKNKDRSIVSLYLRVENMVTKYCQLRDGVNCSRVCTRHSSSLKDNKGYEFKILHDIECTSHMYNSAVKNILSKRKNLEEGGFKKFYIAFFDEDEEVVREVQEAFFNYKNFSIKNQTYGHYFNAIQ